MIVQNHNLKCLQYAIVYALMLLPLLIFLPEQYHRYKVNPEGFS
jgi:hypothetical protein